MHANIGHINEIVCGQVGNNWEGPRGWPAAISGLSKLAGDVEGSCSELLRAARGGQEALPAHCSVGGWVATDECHPSALPALLPPVDLSAGSSRVGV